MDRYKKAETIHLSHALKFVLPFLPIDGSNVTFLGFLLAISLKFLLWSSHGKPTVFHGVMLIDTKLCFDYCFTSCPETQKCRIKIIHISIFVAFFFKAMTFAQLPRFLVIMRMSCSTMVHQDQF